MHGLCRQRPAPQVQVVRDVGRLRTPVREGIGPEHVWGDLGAGGHDLVDDPRVAHQGLFGGGETVADSHLPHDRDDPARIVAPRAPQAREALGALPDVLLHLLVDEFDVLARGRLGDAPGAEVVELCRGAYPDAYSALVTAKEVVRKTDVTSHLLEQLGFGLVRHFGVTGDDWDFVVGVRLGLLGGFDGHRNA